MPSSSLLLRTMPLVFVLIWSTGWVVAGYSAPYADPLTFLSLRYACAAVLVAAFAVVSGATWPKTRRAWADTLLTGVLLHAIYLGSVWWALPR
jgi:drug/metabolite transporter (DMT)-like permease